MEYWGRGMTKVALVPDVLDIGDMEFHVSIVNKLEK
jgi:hypothetical protein